MRFWLAALLLLATAAHAAEISVVDDSGATVAFDTPPQRIISLAPNLTELAYAAGMGQHMVAVTAYSNYPAAAKKLPQVGDAFRLDWEHIVSFRPDLVLAWKSGLSARDRNEFQRLHLKLLVLEPRRLEDIPRDLRLLGRIANTQDVADAVAQEFERRRDELQRRYASRPVVRAYFQIATAPLLTVNGAHIISDVLRLCGARNVFADASLLTPAISDEALVKAQPQILFGIADTPRQRQQILAGWRPLPLAAVRNGHIAFIPFDLISRATPRLLEGAAQVCRQVEKVRQ